jgi:hypothetical protein
LIKKNKNDETHQADDHEDEDCRKVRATTWEEYAQGLDLTDEDPRIAENPERKPITLSRDLREMDGTTGGGGGGGSPLC